MPIAEQDILLDMPEQPERKAEPQHGELKLRTVNRQQTVMAQIDVEELYVAAGYLTGDALPELRPYLRAKYGLTEEQTGKIEGYLQAVCDTNQMPREEGRHDTRDEAT